MAEYEIKRQKTRRCSPQNTNNMKNTNPITNKWLQLEINKCPQFIIRKIGKENVLKSIQKDVEENMNYCSDDVAAKRFFDFAKIKGTSPEDYKYRHLQTRLGEMITSIRFIGGDLNKPAVFLMYKDFELNSMSDIQEITTFISKEYAIFQPQRIRWYSKEIETKLIDSHDSITGDLAYMAGFIEDLKKNPFPNHYEAISLVQTKTLHWYEDYVKTFEKIYKEWPAFVEMAQVESQETLNDLIPKKLLFDIHIDGKWAGIIAADQGSDSFLNGYYIVEEFLTEAFRGKNYAAAVQRHLIEKLPASNQEMLFGTIHYDNTPSLKTAFRVGREVVGMYVFARI